MIHMLNECSLSNENYSLDFVCVNMIQLHRLVSVCDCRNVEN